MSKQRNNQNDVFVSICCITYNHVDYIAQTLDSFLMQETDFSFEIVIHDDASPDGTGDIIREYQSRYPQLIRAILQKENQHSQGKRPFSIALEQCRGKYIATCEGDDFWIDRKKLQKQVNHLESDNKTVASFHRVKEVLPDLTELGTFTQPPFDKENGVYNIKDIILFDGGKIHLSSLVFRKDALIPDGKIDSLYYKGPVGDLTIMLILAEKGSFHYNVETMSCRRIGVPGGATQRLFWNKEMNARVNARIIEFYRGYNIRTNFAYSDQINHNIVKRSLNDLIDQRKYLEIVRSHFYKKQVFLKKAKITLHYMFPRLYRRLYERTLVQNQADIAHRHRIAQSEQKRDEKQHV